MGHDRGGQPGLLPVLPTRGLPGLERGECPVCCGSTFATRDGDRCHHCGHTVPVPPNDFTDEDQEHGEQLHAAEGDR